MTDAELVARACAGEVEAFGRLVDRYYDDCTRFARRMLGNRDDAEDALQEAFVHAFRGLVRYQERDAFRGWLYRIVVNECRRLAARRWRNEKRMVRDDVVLQRVASREENGRELHDQLQKSIGQLDPMLREAFLLKYGEELDYEEMAQMTGASVSALKMRVKRARDRLRPMLEREGEVDGPR
jgi:RNA polymerase sigma-70 factor (ECF subfamily)